MGLPLPRHVRRESPRNVDGHLCQLLDVPLRPAAGKVQRAELIEEYEKSVILPCMLPLRDTETSPLFDFAGSLSRFACSCLRRFSATT